jgi:hypothetical protein
MHETGEIPPELTELDELAMRGWDETPPDGGSDQTT